MTHRQVPHVMYIGKPQHFGKLLAQANLHLVLGGVNAIFSQTAGLDVAVENDDFMPALGNLLRSKQPRRPRSHNEYSFHSVPFASSSSFNERLYCRAPQPSE